MKLDFNFDLLHQSVQEMGAEDRGFTLETAPTSTDPIDSALEIGIIVESTEIERQKNGLISYKGRQVLLYIQDHGKNIDAALANGADGRKYHVAYCSTLDEMHQDGRFERYVVKNAIDGSFFITGFNYGTREYKDGMAKLKVCKNCLNHLNYQGYKSGDQASIFSSFSLSEFFENYQAYFKYTPIGRAGERKDGNYTDDWTERSRQYRASVSWTCESCGLDLSHNKNLLHSHHRNGVKSDNSNSNLQALCIECHARQPKHDMEVTSDERKILKKLRSTQSVW